MRLFALLLALLMILPAAPDRDPWVAGAAWADDDDNDDDDDDDDDDGDDDGPGGGSSGGGSGGGGSGGGSDGGGNDARVRARPDGGAALIELFQGLFGTPGGNSDVAPRELIGFGLSPADVAALSQAGFTELSGDQLAGLGERLSRLRAPDGLGLAEALEAARAAAPAALLDFNHLYTGGGQACDGPDCWGAALVRIAAAPADACARGAPVAIIDTAVDAAHPALRGANVVGRSFLSEGLTPAPPDHGTAVAALLVGRAATPPLAPGARLMAAAAFAMRDDEQRADAAAVIRGLDWAVAGRARVISMSLEGAPNALLARAVAVAARRANLVAAAGNGGARAEPAYPAAYPEVLAVAALDRRKRPWRGGTRGGYIDLAAPGVDVASAGPGGGVTRWTGTSFAAPFAAAALLRARAETRGDAEAARRLLLDAAEDLAAPGRDDATGHGLVRAPGARCW